MTALDARARAEAAWRALVDGCVVRRWRGGLVVRDGPGRRASTAALWPLTQVVAAAVDAHSVGAGATGPDVRALLDTLAGYRHGDGYAPFPGGGVRYYDDNAWVALDLLQLHLVQARPVSAATSGPVDGSLLAEAQRVWAFVGSGAAPDGGIRWVENDLSRNTCATAPAVEVAARLAQLTDDHRLVDVADHHLRWLDQTLRDDEGLYADHLDASGRIEPTIWTYNQGTALGAHVLLHRITGDIAYLDRARRTADAALAWCRVEDRLWTHPPAFNAVFFRNLLALQAVAPDSDDVAALDAYLDRVWHQGRDPHTGLFTAGGIGSYDGRPTIDHAGLTQLFALRAWPPTRWPDIC